MAALTSQAVVETGLAPTFAAATSGAGGDTFSCDGRTFLVVKNGGGSSINVTLTSTAPARPGLATTDRVVAVTNGTEKWIAVDPAGFASATDGTAKATYSAVTSVTVAAIRLP